MSRADWPCGKSREIGSRLRPRGTRKSLSPVVTIVCHGKCSPLAGQPWLGNTGRDLDRSTACSQPVSRVVKQSALTLPTQRISAEFAGFSQPSLRTSFSAFGVRVFPRGMGNAERIKTRLKII
jgi:hypothetical protein